jgi:hypothetical protein
MIRLVMSRKLEHLQETNRHLADAERRIAEQRDRVAKLERGGQDTLAGAATFERTRDFMVTRRNMILRDLRGTTSTP